MKPRTSCLNGTLQGRWRFFLDSNNQSGLHEPVDPRVLLRLRGAAAVQRLRRNCRNTSQIVLQTQLVTGADIGVATIEGEGPPVEWVNTSDERSTAAALAGRLTSWLEQGVRPGHITVLSGRRLAESAARLLPPALRLTPVTASLVSQWPPSFVTFSTVRDFKGLENRCIAIVDLDDFDGSPAAIAEMYVAMTRAHAGVWIAVPPAQRPQIDGLMRKHTEELLRSGGLR